MENRTVLTNLNSRYFPAIVGIVSTVFLIVNASIYFYLFRIVSLSTFEEISDVIFNFRVLELAFRSLFLALIVALGGCFFGFVFAVLVERTNLWFKKTWHILLVISMAIPSYVLAYAWVTVDDRIASFSGAAFLLTLVVTPFNYLNIKAALRNLDPSLEDVSRSLGQSNLKTLTRVILPQLKKSILSGMLISILYTITDFGAVSTLRVEVFTWVIYNSYKLSFDPERAAILASLLFVVAACVVLFESYLGERKKRTGNRKVSHATKSINLGKLNVVFQLVFSVFFLCLFFLPIARSISWMFEYSSSISFEELKSPLINTLFVALIVTSASVFFAFCIAVSACYSRRGLAIEKIVMAFHGVPGIVTAIAFVYVGTRVVPEIYLEWYLLFIALTIAFAYLAVGPIKNTLSLYSKSFIENSYALDQSKISTLWKVTFPLSLNGLKAGSILVFVATVKELPITLILRPNGENTLATTMWSNVSVSRYGVIAPTILLLLVICIVPLLFLIRGRYD